MRALSTIHPLKENQQRWCKVRPHRGHEPTILDCPVSVRDYNVFMRGVDRNDQLITLYNGGRRTKKWWKRLFWHELESQLLNSFVIYKCLINSKEPFLRFKSSLIEQLIRRRAFRKDIGRPRLLPLSVRLDSSPGHMIRYTDSGKRSRCRVCSKARSEAGYKVEGATTVATYCSVCNISYVACRKGNVF